MDPSVEMATYQSADGRSFPAHVFSAKQETGTFKVTVVEMPGEETGPNAAMMKVATNAVTEGGMIKFDIEHRVRAVYGRQLASLERTVATPTWHCSTGIIASIRSRAPRFSQKGRRRLTRHAFSSRSISPDRACHAPLTTAG
jgi:hypothetical protein